MTQDDHMETITDRPHVVDVDEHGYHRCRDCGLVGGAPPDLPCSGTITDPALIRATDEPDERGDFPCCTTPAPASGVGLDLDAIEARQKAAASARWEIIGDRDGPRALMALLGEDVPALVAEVRRLTEENASYADELLTCDREEWHARALSAEAEVVTLRARLAEAEALHWKVGGACSHCSQRSDYAVAWPCETAVALAGTTGEGE